MNLHFFHDISLYLDGRFYELKASWRDQGCEAFERRIIAPMKTTLDKMEAAEWELGVQTERVDEELARLAQPDPPVSL